MNTLILGFADDHETDPCKAKATFDVADFDKAQRLHRFPDGVKALRMFTVEEVATTIFISDDVTKSLNDREGKRVEAEKQAKAAAAERSKSTDAMAAAQDKVKATARARNELMGKLHSTETSLRNHDATPETLRGKLHDKTVASLRSVIFGDPEKKVAGLKDQVAAAIADYEKAAKELDALMKPVNEKLSPSPKSQLVEA